MKKLVMFSLLLLNMTHFEAISQLNYLQNMPALASHPRLMLLAGEEKGIRANVDKDTHWAEVHQTIISECDKLIAAEPVKRIQIGRRLLDKSREALRRIFYLSYAYRMTSDQKYLQRAEKELLAVSQFSDWNPTHFLDVAEMTMAVAIGYDWLHNDLQKSSLSIIKEAILKKGLEPSLDSKYNAWLKATHNWNQVCNAGMTYGALAIYEENPDLCKKIIDRAITTIKLPMEDYLPDGAYPEGYSYWGYGTTFNVLFLSAIERALGNEFGLASEKGFLNTARYYQQMIGTSGKAFNYSDAGNASNHLSPAMFWFAKRTNDASLLFNERKAVNEKQISGKDRVLPAALIWGNGLSLQNATTPTQLLWVGQGRNPVAMMRASWTDPNAIYIGLKAGSPSVNHAHMDVGSFVMDAMGGRWAIDLGMQEYESLESKGIKLWGREQNAERWQVYRYNNLTHNTLTFDGKHQLVNAFAKIESFSDNPNRLSAFTDITSAYAENATAVRREVSILNKISATIKDEIKTADKPTTVRWTMVTPAQVEIRKDGVAVLSQNGKQLILQVVSPKNAKLTTWDTTPTHDYDAPNPNTIRVGFEVSLPAGATTQLEVALIPVNKDTKRLRKQSGVD